MRFYDAHNHLQAEEMAEHWPRVFTFSREHGIARMVVNGATETDWSTVAELSERDPVVLPSFGLHPGYIGERTPDWREHLNQWLAQTPGAVMGEIGLDRWIEEFDFDDQQEVFIAQWRMALECQLPVTVHCRRAWGRLEEILRVEGAPARGFLLHSYGGSREMIESFAALGAYFSVSGQFAMDWKRRQLGNFQTVPHDRLLIETDAPFMLPPEELREISIADATGQALNHPANLVRIYAFVSRELDWPLERLALQVEENFHRLFTRKPEAR